MPLPTPSYPSYEEIHQLLNDPKIGPQVMALMGTPDGMEKINRLVMENHRAKAKERAA